MRFLILFLLSVSCAQADLQGLMQPYSSEGTYSIANGKARIVIEKDGNSHLQYRIIHLNRRGEEGTGGNPDFIKNPQGFFVFAQDADHYWIYDGQSDVIHFTFTENAMTAESLSCVPSHFLAMPDGAASLLPQSVRKKIK